MASARSVCRAGTTWRGGRARLRRKLGAQARKLSAYKQKGNIPKERRPWNTDHGHDESSVQVVVAHLTGRLGHERASVAGRPLEPALLEVLAGSVVGTDRIVRAEAGHSEREGEVILDVARLLRA